MRFTYKVNGRQIARPRVLLEVPLPKPSGIYPQCGYGNNVVCMLLTCGKFGGSGTGGVALAGKRKVNLSVTLGLSHFSRCVLRTKSMGDKSQDLGCFSRSPSPNRQGYTPQCGYGNNVVCMLLTCGKFEGSGTGGVALAGKRKVNLSVTLGLSHFSRCVLRTKSMGDKSQDLGCFSRSPSPNRQGYTPQCGYGNNVVCMLLTCGKFGGSGTGGVALAGKRKVNLSVTLGLSHFSRCVLRTKSMGDKNLDKFRYDQRRTPMDGLKT
ncbi:hypothetical protein HOLleu_08708 [Holothuria leucospilota]|uniref:Uncharacterized protein n=1 Tax=Holothuria leucospilota TaxID=206669 RepID=A0A9Q1CI09_HOLLE|nr:hypothetical protein HOLleu_08708 [Holothuria leucospilota]